MGILHFRGGTALPKTNLSYRLPEKLKNQGSPPSESFVNYFSGFWGKNIKNCPPSKLFLFVTSLDERTKCLGLPGELPRILKR